MRKIIFYIKAVLTAAFFLLTTAGAQQIKLSSLSTYQEKLNQSTLLFMENKGQVVDDNGNVRTDILFTANSGGAKIYLTASGIHYQFTKTEYPKGYDPFSKKLIKDHKTEEELIKRIKTTTHKFTVALQGANLAPTVVKEGRHDYFENYYLPQCPNGITGVASFEKVTFKNVYSKIDWVVYSKDGFMEYDFLVHPGGDPANIKLQVKDADSVSITPQGELSIKTSLGEVKEKAPISYADGQIVSSRFIQNSDGSIGFDVKLQVEKELLIDPSVVWATYYGGSGGEYGQSCTTDINSNVFLAGFTTSTSGIAMGGFQNSYAGGSGYDAFLVKCNSNGSRLWATYYGGNNYDYGETCVADANGNIYLSGLTASATGIAFGGFQNNFGGGSNDAFLVKFNSSGGRIWGTYYGGSDYDNSYYCTLDGIGNVYLSGGTYSTNGIASNGFQNTKGGGEDAFLVKLNSSGGRLWATYYGGSNYDHGASCKTDASGNVYLAGTAESVTGISSNGFQNIFGGGVADAFLVKFSSTGNRLWASYYGSSDSDVGYSCTTDNNGNVYLAGVTLSTSGIASNGFQNTYGGGSNDAFLVKFNSNGSRLWATYYGGSDRDYGQFCITDNSDNVYLVGITTSINNIASGGIQNTRGGDNDAFLVKFDSGGNRIWSTYYGGTDLDYGQSCVVDANGSIYLAGVTASTTNISFNGFQNIIGGVSDGYLCKINDGGEQLPLFLISLKAFQQATSIKVEWAVQKESNLKVYEIEKSLDGVNFTKVGEKLATGSYKYDWLDTNPKTGSNFYRLRLIDLDGTIRHSSIIKVLFGKYMSSYQIYPNPIMGNTLSISFVNKPTGIYWIYLYNALSQLLLTKKINHTGGNSAETITLKSTLSKGSYQLKITEPDNRKNLFRIVR